MPLSWKEIFMLRRKVRKGFVTLVLAAVAAAGQLVPVQLASAACAVGVSGQCVVGSVTGPSPIIETSNGPILEDGAVFALAGSLVTATVTPGAVGGAKVVNGPVGYTGDTGTLGAVQASGTNYCNADSCTGVSMPDPPQSFGKNCTGTGNRVQAGGSVQFYYPDQQPDNYAIAIASGNTEASGCQNNQEVCILTISFETKGARTMQYGQADPLGTIPGTSTGTVNYGVNVGYSSNGASASASLGGSYNVTQGQTEGKLYDDGEGGSTGYVAAWEYTQDTCRHSAQVAKGSVWWAYPYSDDSNMNYSIFWAANYWYNKNQTG
jgi:hypothetical protein